MKIIVEFLGGKYDGKRYAFPMNNPPEYLRMPLNYSVDEFLKLKIHVTLTEYQRYEIKLDEFMLPRRKDDGTYIFEYKGIVR